MDAHIAARLEISGRVFYGHNGHEIDTTFDKVNAITKTDAEGHVTQRALNAGMKGKAKQLIFMLIENYALHVVETMVLVR